MREGRGWRLGEGLQWSLHLQWGLPQRCLLGTRHAHDFYPVDIQQVFGVPYGVLHTRVNQVLCRFPVATYWNPLWLRVRFACALEFSGHRCAPDCIAMRPCWQPDGTPLLLVSATSARAAVGREVDGGTASPCVAPALPYAALGWLGVPGFAPQAMAGDVHGERRVPGGATNAF